MTATIHPTQDRYHQGAGRDCPDCDPDRIPAGLRVTGWGEGLISYPAAREPLQLEAAEIPRRMPDVDEVGTLEMFSALGRDK